MASVATDDYDANLASFRFLSLGGFVMAWRVYLPTGTVEVGSADLKRMAANGEIEKSTIVESTTNKVRTKAVGIAGLVFKEEDVNLLDLPIPEVPQTPPTWNPPEDMHYAFQEAPWAAIQKTIPAPKKASFMDYNFDFLVTPSLVSTIWLLWLAVGGLSVIATAFAANARTMGDAKAVVGGVLASLALFIFLTIAVRVALETIIVVFKICEYLKRLNDKS